MATIPTRRRFFTRRRRRLAAGTEPEVLGWVAGNPHRARVALAAERAGQARAALIETLEGVAAG
jgi:hypothetical protein